MISQLRHENQRLNDELLALHHQLSQMVSGGGGNAASASSSAMHSPLLFASNVDSDNESAACYEDGDFLVDGDISNAGTLASVDDFREAKTQ